MGEVDRAAALVASVSSSSVAVTVLRWGWKGEEREEVRECEERKGMPTELGKQQEVDGRSMSNEL